ncbi:transcription termination/antitermination protein NusG [Paracoccus sp. (in: a-proteobacteria)]|uniref:transcription termination/antitermination protein NusG n=1 Tax=Paracoccus sp. TaxID=267 RepID=UPI003919C0F6
MRDHQSSSGLAGADMRNTTVAIRPARFRGCLPPTAWYGIRCLTGKEGEARDQIAVLGLEVCVPTYQTRTWPRKKRVSVVVERPLCPGYVFAFIPPDRWPDIRACNRVIGWIADDSGPLPVGRPEQIIKLHNAALAGAYDEKAVEGRLRPGDELEVLFGPFAGWRVAFMALKGRAVEGELAILGAARRVLIPAENLHMRKR